MERSFASTLSGSSASASTTTATHTNSTYAVVPSATFRPKPRPGTSEGEPERTRSKYLELQVRVSVGLGGDAKLRPGSRSLVSVRVPQCARSWLSSSDRPLSRPSMIDQNREHFI